MGNEFEVWVWRKSAIALAGYEWVKYWGGDSIADAFQELANLKDRFDLVKLEWRSVV